MANDVSNVKIEPVEANWGNPETTKITAVADSSGSLNNKFFSMTSQDGTLHHVWYDINGVGVDPAPANSTPITVTGATDATAAAIASSSATAIDLIAKFNSKIDSGDSTSFIVENVGIGTATDTVDSDTTFTILQLRDGSDFDLGLMDGDIDFSPTEDLFDVTAHQTGTQIQDKIRTGNNVAPIVIAMKESIVAKLKEILEAGGASVTPGGGTEVTGYGKTKQFLNISNDTRYLILHPVRLAAGVFTDDIAIWRAYPNLTGLNFSGESDRKINVEFQVIPDPLKLDAINMFVLGNHQQNLLL